MASRNKCTWRVGGVYVGRGGNLPRRKWTSVFLRQEREAQGRELEPQTDVGSVNHATEGPGMSSNLSEPQFPTAMSEQQYYVRNQRAGRGVTR